ncbi:hypothetical protein K501DRAFT_235883 [Backusella circina FSU 941]|nr:hypothetical protein K501DRAFT_235883 [Backusella circina FSU 941]
MRRSMSTGTISNGYSRFHNEDLYQQETYDKNQYYEHVSDDYEELDGEPMTELEKLAAKNALYNQASSRYLHHDNLIPPSSPLAFLPTKDNAENDTPSESSLTPTSSSITLVDSNVNSCTATNKEGEQSSDPSAQFQKKKLWPFSSLLKKAQAISSPITSPNLFKPPTQSNSTPYRPTPLVSPSSTASSSPIINHNKSNITNHHNQSTVWAFRVPVHHVNSTIWRRFDDINQQKLNQHVGSNNFKELDMFDSHIGSGKVPIVVVPFQRVCYYPTDLSMQNLICLEIRPFASHVYNS